MASDADRASAPAYYYECQWRLERDVLRQCIDNEEATARRLRQALAQEKERVTALLDLLREVRLMRCLDTGQGGLSSWLDADWWDQREKMLEEAGR